MNLEATIFKEEKLPRLLYFCSSDAQTSKEVHHLFNYLPEWDVVYLAPDQQNVEEISRILDDKEIHFMVFNRELSTSGIEILNRLSRSFPLIPTIYYSAQMNSNDFQILKNANIKHCIVGDGRQIFLIKSLQELWKSHWKKIPERLLPVRKTKFVKKVVEIIQNQPIKDFNTRYIAGTLEITEEQFREQFKRQFASNFRAFKQAVLDHYETELLFRRRLKPGEIYSVLSYRNLSAFSRSFRIRHGASWQAVMRKAHSRHLAEV